ncbi:hypothetical protein GCM10009665_28280 [Kitasatospora nipponensis]|uniref:LppP/LprE lipoprotein n=1 Tax=Kitasatospora nipponensis TaxID=258049 RepID=A0ABP4GSL2_9ACTN
MIERADLVGDWGNAAGARLHVAVDHRATVSGLNQAVPDTKCPADASDAAWQFWVPVGAPGSYVGSDSATKGDSFTLALRTATADPNESCDVDVEVQRDQRGFNLCLVMDPDQSCTSGELLRKVAARPQ